jgi:hypothetical protein
MKGHGGGAALLETIFLVTTLVPRTGRAKAEKAGRFNERCSPIATADRRKTSTPYLVIWRRVGLGS